MTRYPVASEEDVRAMARESPDFFTPEGLETALERWRELHTPDKRARGNAS